MLNLGIARLEVEQRGEKSVVVEQFGKAPLQVHRPLYLDGQSYPTVFLRTPSSGLLGGDSHVLDVMVKPNAVLELRTQAACLIYPGVSSSQTTIRLHENSKLIFLPHPLILAADAQFTQNIRIEMTESSSLVFLESWSAGRLAMGETWQFASFNNTVEIYTDTQLVFREHWQLKPRQSDPEQSLVCGSYKLFETLYRFGAQESLAEDRIHNYLSGISENSLRWQMLRGQGIITKTLRAN